MGKEPKRKKTDLRMPNQYCLELAKPISGTNRNITTDNWYSSCELAEELGKKHPTIVTVRKHKPDFPPQLLNSKRPLERLMFIYEPEKIMVSHIPKANKNVILLSSTHSTGEIDTKTEKPEIILFYNKFKGGIDVF